MPIITINMLEGRSIEKKRALVEKVTQAVVEAVDAPADHVRIILNDMPTENYAVAGKLKADGYK